MRSWTPYTTSNFELFPLIMGQFTSDNSGIIDSRAMLQSSLLNIYKSWVATRPNNVAANHLIKSFLYPKQATLLDQSFEETYYYQDKNLVNKILKLVENIGIKLFRKLDDKQKILMARTAGSLEFSSKIDINSVYSYIESNE